MKIRLTSNKINMILMGLLILLGIGSFAYNQYLIGRILTQEKLGVELWANAVEYTGNPVQENISKNLQQASNYLRRSSDVPDSIIAKIDNAESDRTSQNFITQEIVLNKDRFQVPRIIVNQKGQIISANHVRDSLSQDLIKRYASMHAPIKLSFGEGNNARVQYVYYGESPMVQLLRYFPYVQLGLLALLLGIGIISYRTIMKSEQSKLWVGMAKEAAHQLGTPLSSLYGWIELLREEKKQDDFSMRICNELENDILRLQGVADRFNKIGSEPKLSLQKLEPLILDVVRYMEQRLPQLGKNVQLNHKLHSGIQANVNPELFRWALENLIKNAMDAINPSAENALVAVRLKQIEQEVYIDVEDNGSGIEKKYQHQIFKPGYSTKNRGWGLGLSLTQRIIDEYHQGSLSIYQSNAGQGTTMRIALHLDPPEEATSA